ncbi:formyltransferase family protein [Cupriavidus basilensis]
MPISATFDAALAKAIDAGAPPGISVVLAGPTRIPTPGLCRQVRRAHAEYPPSLLPCFPGLHTHRQAIEAVSRSTAPACIRHAGTRSAPSIAIQAALDVLPDDTP